MWTPLAVTTTHAELMVLSHEWPDRPGDFLSEICLWKMRLSSGKCTYCGPLIRGSWPLLIAFFPFLVLRDALLVQVQQYEESLFRMDLFCDWCKRGGGGSVCQRGKKDKREDLTNRENQIIQGFDYSSMFPAWMFRSDTLFIIYCFQCLIKRIRTVLSGAGAFQDLAKSKSHFWG